MMIPLAYTASVSGLDTSLIGCFLEDTGLESLKSPTPQPASRHIMSAHKTAMNYN